MICSSPDPRPARVLSLALASCATTARCCLAAGAASLERDELVHVAEPARWWPLHALPATHSGTSRTRGAMHRYLERPAYFAVAVPTTSR